jgi:hypothetical protein
MGDRERQDQKVYNVDDFLLSHPAFGSLEPDLSVIVGNRRDGNELVFRVHRFVFALASSGRAFSQFASELNISLPPEIFDTSMETLLTFFIMVYTATNATAVGLLPRNGISSVVSRQSAPLLFHLSSCFSIKPVNDKVKEFLATDMTCESLSFYYNHAMALDLPDLRALVATTCVSNLMNVEDSSEIWSVAEGDFLLEVMNAFDLSGRPHGQQVQMHLSRIIVNQWRRDIDLPTSTFTMLKESFLRLDCFDVQSLWQLGKIASAQGNQHSGAIAELCIASLRRDPSLINRHLGDIGAVCEADDIFRMFASDSATISTAWSLSLRLLGQKCDDTAKKVWELHRKAQTASLPGRGSEG